MSSYSHSVPSIHLQWFISVGFKAWVMVQLLWSNAHQREGAEQTHKHSQTPWRLKDMSWQNSQIIKQNTPLCPHCTRLLGLFWCSISWVRMTNHFHNTDAKQWNAAFKDRNPVGCLLRFHAFLLIYFFQPAQKLKHQSFTANKQVINLNDYC